MLWFNGTWLVGFVLGATIGSFDSVLIYRLPRRISLARPARSFCPACGHKLAVRDIVPVLGWLQLRGRCRYCKCQVPVRYFVVEVINGCIWAALWYRFMIVGDDWLAMLSWALALIVAIAFLWIQVERGLRELDRWTVRHPQFIKFQMRAKG